MPSHFFKLLIKEFPAYLLYYLKKCSPHGSYPVVLMYHSVNEHTDHRLVVKPDIFNSQIQYLVKNHWEIVPLHEIVSGISSNTGQTQKVALTFDDGYEDNYSIVSDILKKHAAPATIFLIANYVGTQKIFPWFGENEKWAVSMGWDQIKLLQQDGIEFGAHTKNHPLLSTITSEKTLRDELIDSKNNLEAKVGGINYFCYPAGDYTQKAKSVVEEAGYLGAVSVEPGFVTSDTDRFLVPRIEISGFDHSIDIFSRKMSGCYIPFHKILQRWQKISKHIRKNK